MNTYVENSDGNRLQHQTWFWLLALFLALTLWAGKVAAEVVNINKADVAALQEHLPGIGPVKAQAIVDYRNSNGPFKSMDDLKNVKGIGDGIMKKIRSNISTSKGITKASKDFKAKSAGSAKSRIKKGVSEKKSKLSKKATKGKKGEKDKKPKKSKKKSSGKDSKEKK